MSTNYYRIPTVNELEQSRSKLLMEIRSLDVNDVRSVLNRFETFDEDMFGISPWHRFQQGLKIHL